MSPQRLLKYSCTLSITIVTQVVRVMLPNTHSLALIAIVYFIFLNYFSCVILDEADHMLEKGFADTMDQILALAFHGGESLELLRFFCMFIYDNLSVLHLHLKMKTSLLFM